MFLNIMRVCGIDEAGRGPVIGPLVIAGVVADGKAKQKLIEIGVKDSKKIAPKKREQMFNTIKSIVNDYYVLIVKPDEIDEALNSQTLNLNWLEAIKSAMIVNKLKPEKVILDAPSNNIKAYTDYFRIYLKNKDIDIVCEHKADETYPEVSAASILAKVTRDNEIEKLKQKYGDFGSGYPSDPKTKEFLRHNWKKCKEIFRTTWSSYKNAAGFKLTDFK
ncbi:ribonuclease HII [Candidatus Woesearchaeota archaeon]|nr:MAG: ribonuclease HII [Candidatus Woesearchaeota archaeon]